MIDFDKVINTNVSLQEEKNCYNVMYKRATNRKSDKLGAIQKWEIWIEVHEGVPCIMREAGQIDGKRNVKKMYVKKGKNIGKANETSPYEQAILELTKMVKEKIEENCVADVADIDLPPRFLYPALAVKHNLKKTEKLLKERGYVYVQAKLNGARTWRISHLPADHQHSETPTHVQMSRKLKPFTTLGHFDDVLDIFDGCTPDGEVFNKSMDFQEIISLLKKEYKRGEHPDYPLLATTDLQYHIYDLAILDKTYEERKEILEGIFDEYNKAYPDCPTLQPVTTHRCESMEEIDKWNEHYIILGYEGLIIRDPLSMYAFCDRNDSLIKYKKFYDDEFEIIGYSYEIWDDVLTGKMRKLVKWECVTKDGFEFTSRPKGKFLARERMYKVADQAIGKMLTVRYQDLSKDGVPNMNIGNMGSIESEIIRDYE